MGRQRDEDIHLAEAALLISRSVYPDLAVQPYLARLDAFAAAVRERVTPSADALQMIAEINRQLYEVEGFRGNEREYYDPRNSYLNEVLDRKLGIPITLSIVFMEVAQRVGLPVFGVGLPGHFVVKVATVQGDVFLDPFNGGGELTEEDCQQRLDRVYGGLVHLERTMLLPVTRRQILIRVLNNLKTIHLNDGEFDRAMEVVQSILILEPASLPDMRDRGLLHYRQNRWTDALSDLRKYLMLAHDADDREQVAQTVRAIEFLQSMTR